MSQLMTLDQTQYFKLATMTGRSVNPHQAPHYSAYELQVPKDTTGLANRAMMFIHSLYWLNQKVILTIRADYQYIRWLVTPLDNQPLQLEEVEAMLEPHFSDAKISLYQAPIQKRPFIRQWGIYQLRQPQWFTPLNTLDDFKRELPLQALVSRMMTLKKDEVAILEIYVTGGRMIDDQELTQLLFVPASEVHQPTPRITFNWIQALIDVGRTFYEYHQLSQQLVPRYPTADEKRYIAKLTQPLFQTKLTLIFDTPYQTRRRLFTALESALQAWRTSESTLLSRLVNSKSGEGNLISTYNESVFEHPIIQLARNAVQPDIYPDLLSHTTLNLTADELATFWHLPTKEFI